MKKGDKVRCVKLNCALPGYLIPGKVYTVTAGKGDERNSFIGNTEPFDNDFNAQITDEDGDSITIIVDAGLVGAECGYAEWEIVE